MNFAELVFMAHQKGYRLVKSTVEDGYYLVFTEDFPDMDVSMTDFIINPDTGYRLFPTLESVHSFLES